MERKKIKILKDGVMNTANLIIDQNGLQFIWDDLDLAVADDMPFAALQALRKALEKHGILLLIKGARKDVYPSPMLSNTNGAYIHRLGQPSFSKDIVNIFEDLDDISLATTVDEQYKYHKEWADSMRNLPAPE